MVHKVEPAYCIAVEMPQFFIIVAQMLWNWVRAIDVIRVKAFLAKHTDKVLVAIIVMLMMDVWSRLVSQGYIIAPTMHVTRASQAQPRSGGSLFDGGEREMARLARLARLAV